MRSLPTVLAVDDDAVMRALLRRVFGDAGLAVETFDSARDLLDHAAFDAPAVLLLDVRMPGISGIELQALLKARGVSLPIVFLTGSSDIPTAVEAMRCGAADFLEKPFDPVALLARVRRSLLTASAPPDPAVRRSNPDFAECLGTLTSRERQVYDFMITGKSSKLIARELGGSFRTIEIHRSRVMTKMKCESLADLVRMTFEVDPA
ncbi:MAG TPA: response regulator [Burkholderiaceae bacterium]|jgi:FixJ family two-component response regulator